MNTCSVFSYDHFDMCFNRKAYTPVLWLHTYCCTKDTLRSTLPFRMWISYNNIRYHIKRISRWDAGYSTFYTWRCCCRTQNTWLCHIHVKRRFEYFMAKLLSSMLWIEIMWCFMHGKVMTMRFIYFFFCVVYSDFFPQCLY